MSHTAKNFLSTSYVILKTASCSKKVHVVKLQLFSCNPILDEESDLGKVLCSGKSSWEDPECNRTWPLQPKIHNSSVNAGYPLSLQLLWTFTLYWCCFKTPKFSSSVQSMIEVVRRSLSRNFHFTLCFMKWHNQETSLWWFILNKAKQKALQ